ncbi:MAG: PASTA domain-containing protein [Roseburia sp.]|nr:PASTA domain-containing protein [Roseburia sp.]MCM1278569.1 PASTA domain-containing protein [Robinsoniella sp.]
MERHCGNCFYLYEGNDICPNCGYDNRQERVGSNCLNQGFSLAGRYIIGRVLGIGGFGITYLAYDTVLSQRVAIKEYLPNEFSTRVPTQAQVTIYTGDKKEQFLAGQKRFVDEAKKLAKFQNQSQIVSIFDCFDENNTSYIVMEYLCGKTVQEVLKEQGKIEPERAVSISLSVLKALETVHQAGILHRDISPDNIFLTEEGKVKLIDFGAARYATTSHSKSLSVIIKQGYAPIEQYRSRGEQGPWTDVYGVAATLYKMITGSTPKDSMERAVKDELLPPSKCGIKIDKSLENAIMNGLNVPIEGRPKSAKAFYDELSAKTVKRTSVKTKKTDIGKWPMGIKVVGFVLTAAVTVVMVMIAKGQFNVAVAGWSSYDLKEGQTRVPNIVNTDLDVAQKEVEEQSLVFVITNKEYSAEIPKDKVLLQSLHAGSVVEEGTIVEVTVSGGAKEDFEEAPAMAEDETTVPDIQYKSEDEAVSLLEAAGLIAEVKYEASNTVEAGKVIRQETEAGATVKKGTTITIYVSKKEEKKIAPKKSNNVQTPTAPKAPTQSTKPEEPKTETNPQESNKLSEPLSLEDEGWQEEFDLEW